MRELTSIADYYKQGLQETLWRDWLCNYHFYQICVLPEVRATTTYSLAEVHQHLTAEDLCPPWTPDLLLALAWSEKVSKHYSEWSKSDLVVPWSPAEEEDPSLPCAERVFNAALKLFGEDSSISDYRDLILKYRAYYRKCIALMDSDIYWEPFQVDLSSVFKSVLGPEIWYEIVDQIRLERGSDASNFLKQMKLAPVSQVMGLPRSYGVSLRTPSFGYRREHTSRMSMATWAKELMPDTDLFGPLFWEE